MKKSAFRIAVLLKKEKTLVAYFVKSSIEQVTSVEACDDYYSVNHFISESNKRNVPDLLITDTFAVEISEYNILKKLRDEGKVKSVMMVFTQCFPYRIFRGYDCGFEGLITADITGRQFLTAFKDIVRDGKSYYSTTVTRTLNGTRLFPSSYGGNSEVGFLNNEEQTVIVKTREGKSAKEIGECLGCSPRKINSIKANLKAKFNTDNFNEVMIRAYCHKILPL